MHVDRIDTKRKLHLFDVAELRACCGAGRYTATDPIDLVVAPWDHPSMCQGCVDAVRSAQAGTGTLQLSGAFVEADALLEPLPLDWYATEIAAGLERTARWHEAKKAAHAQEAVELGLVDRSAQLGPSETSG
jgi:hypothetical protein